MQKELAVAIHGAQDDKGGIYNVLGNFTQGIFKAFKNKTNTYVIQECIKNSIPFDVALGFNVFCYEIWQKIMDAEILNIMYSVDSIFGQNFEIINKYKNNPKFAVFTVRSFDVEIAKHFMPELQLFFMPHAIDEAFWKKMDSKKDIEAVFLSSIFDWEEQLNKIKNTTPKNTWQIIEMFFNTIIKNPKMNFFEIYKIFCEKKLFSFELGTYSILYNTLLPIVESYQKIKMIQDLKYYPIKIFGNEIWKKYISDKQEYMGKLDVKDSVDVLSRAKIVLHNQSSILGGGLHERFLHACGVESFVLCNNDLIIKNEFKNSFGFYDEDNIVEKYEYYLKNENERKEMIKNAHEFVLKYHTWNNRVDSILKLFI